MIQSISWVLCSDNSHNSVSIDNGWGLDEEKEEEEKDKEDEGDEGCGRGEEDEVEDKDKEEEGDTHSWKYSILKQKKNSFL